MPVPHIGRRALDAQLQSQLQLPASAAFGTSHQVSASHEGHPSGAPSSQIWPPFRDVMSVWGVNSNEKRFSLFIFLNPQSDTSNILFSHLDSKAISFNHFLLSYCINNLGYPWTSRISLG